jgi:hypothetical protein
MTIAEVKKTMTDAFMADPVIIEKYEIKDGHTFDERFPAVTIESIWFFIVATAVWLSFQLFDQHKKDISETLYNNKAHKNQWYAMMAKRFQFGRTLVTDSDYYDNTGLAEAQIEASRIVKFAAAMQPKDKSILYVKIATEQNGVKQPLNNNQLIAFKSYLNEEVADAGVRIEIINAPADQMRLEIDIYYDALVLDSEGQRLDGMNTQPAQEAIRNYLSNLSFNGLYTNQSLIDVLQNVSGVEQAELISAASKYGTYTEFRPINARSVPHAGYYAITDENLILNFIAHEEYI